MRRNTIKRLENQQLAEAFVEMRGVAEKRVLEFDLKRWLKTVLEESMVGELESSVVGVEDYERGPDRQNQRNGFYSRSLHTVFGLIEELKVPRPRVGGFTPSVFERYGRRDKKINEMITECFWRGISTRDMTHITNELTGVHISGSVVSRLTKRWNEEAMIWHKRSLPDTCVYLMLDGVWIKNRSLGKKRRLVLVAYAINKNGEREIVDYQLSLTESENHWLKFLTQLIARGFSAKHLKLIVSDGCKGLHNAIDMAFPLIPHQLCWAHKMRNILKNVKKSDQDEVKKGLKPIFSEKVQTKEQANKVIWSWRKQWRNSYPDAVKCLERDLENLLHYLAFPIEHQKALRTSNHIERQFKEYRRRLKSMELLPNKDSAERALYALTQIRNEKLRAYPVTFTQN